MDSKKRQKFDRIIGLLTSDNIAKAMDEYKVLDPDTQERLNIYIANITLHTESSRYRGRVIEMSIYLELVLANLLSQYFAADNKKELLNSMVFDRKDLQKKFNTLKSILKTQHADLWRTESGSLKKIDSLIAFRNNIAHSVLNSSNEYMDRIRRHVQQLTSQGKIAKHLDEIEFGFFESHSWVYKAIKWSDIESYHTGIHKGVTNIESIGSKIIANFESSIKAE